MPSAKILVVDDEPVMLTSLALVLAGEGFDVRTAGDAKQATVAAAAWLPDVLVADRMLGDGADGIEVAESIRRANPDLRLILITGYASPEVRLRLKGFAGASLLEKPFLPDRLLAALRECGG